MSVHIWRDNGEKTKLFVKNNEFKVPKNQGLVRCILRLTLQEEQCNMRQICCKYSIVFIHLSLVEKIIFSVNNLTQKKRA